MKKRIAVHEVFFRIRYSQAFEALLNKNSYFLISDYRIEKDRVIIKDSDGTERSVPKHWVVFEEEHPKSFELWDSFDREEQQR